MDLDYINGTDCLVDYHFVAIELHFSKIISTTNASEFTTSHCGIESMKCFNANKKNTTNRRRKMCGIF